MSEKTPLSSATGVAFEKERRDILASALRLAPFEGWTPVMARRAATQAGVDQSVLSAAFPGGIRDLIQLWSEQLDQKMSAAMEGDAFLQMRIREKVGFAIRARLDAIGPENKEAARRASAMLALPFYAGLSTRLVWRTVDTVWRGLGDKSVDFNFYSKRAILAGVWTTTFARWLADDSENASATDAFLEARIDNVMQIEKVKGQVQKFAIDPKGPIGLLARLRYRA